MGGHAFPMGDVFQLLIVPFFFFFLIKQGLKIPGVIPVIPASVMCFGFLLI